MQVKFALFLVAAVCTGLPALAAEPMKLPPLKKQPSVQKVIDEHIDALNDGAKLKFKP